jgi:hypothetical protein
MDQGIRQEVKFRNWQLIMNDIDRAATCVKCRKHRLDVKEADPIIRSRNAVGRAVIDRPEYCVCPRCAPDIPEWAYDDLATRLVLTLQYPPGKFRAMYRLVGKHWRRAEPMSDDKVRKEMQYLRQRGQLVFAKKKDGTWFPIHNVSTSFPAFDAARRAYLKDLEVKGILLNYSSWRALQQNRPKRNKMNLTLSEIDDNIIKELDATVEKARLSPRNFDFMASLAPPPFVLEWRCLLSYHYFCYIFKQSAGGLRIRGVALDTTVTEALSLRPQLILLALITLILVPVSMFCTHVSENLDPHGLRLQSLIVWVLRNRSLRFKTIVFDDVLPPAFIAFVIVFLFICWSWCTCAAMLLFSLAAKPLVDTPPTLRQKLQSWFRPFLSRS